MASGNRPMKVRPAVIADLLQLIALVQQEVAYQRQIHPLFDLASASWGLSKTGDPLGYPPAASRRHRRPILGAGSVRDPARHGPAGWHSPQTPQFDHSQCGRPAVWALYPGRVAAFFQKAGFVHEQHGLWVLQRLYHIVTQCLKRRLGVPQRPEGRSPPTKTSDCRAEVHVVDQLPPFIQRL